MNTLQPILDRIQKRILERDKTKKGNLMFEEETLNGRVISETDTERLRVRRKTIKDALRRLIGRVLRGQTSIDYNGKEKTEPLF